jgi:hypothetical protein
VELPKPLNLLTSLCFSCEFPAGHTTDVIVTFDGSTASKQNKHFSSPPQHHRFNNFQIYYFVDHIRKGFTKSCFIPLFPSYSALSLNAPMADMFKQFVIEKKLGTGTYASVFLARHTETHQQVCVTLVDVVVVRGHQQYQCRSH